MAFVHLKQRVYVRDTDLLAVDYGGPQGYFARLRNGDTLQLGDLVFPDNWKLPQWAAAGPEQTHQVTSMIRLDAITTFEWLEIAGAVGEAAFVTLGSQKLKYWLRADVVDEVAKALGTPNA